MPGKITEVPGLLVGNIEDEAGRTGVTVVLCAPPAVAR
jgi:L-aminopeptidase/D-esterase-like protein